MDIINKPIADLIPYINNQKEHPLDQIERIANSIKEFGWAQPITLDGKGEIIIGHGRLMAAQLLGLEEVPCIVMDNLSKEQILALRIADNKLNESAWITDNLKIDFEALYEAEYDLQMTGFNTEELAEYYIGEPDPESDPDNENNVPDAPENVVIKKGDIIEMGNHRLLCGDATDLSDVKKLMNGEITGLFIADPPYNVGYEGGGGYDPNKKSKSRKDNDIENDNLKDKSFRQFLVDSFNCANEVMDPGAVFYVWFSDLEAYNFLGAAKDIKWKFTQMLIWEKNTMVIGRKDYQFKHEPCLYGWKKGAAHYWATDRKQTTILSFERPSRSTIHPTMKPVDLIQYQIENSSERKWIVLDTFGGSGTTMIACENTDRFCRMMELSESYAQVIVQRWCDYTGKDEILINGKKQSWLKYSA